MPSELGEALRRTSSAKVGIVNQQQHVHQVLFGMFGDLVGSDFQETSFLVETKPKGLQFWVAIGQRPDPHTDPSDIHEEIRQRRSHGQLVATQTRYLKIQFQQPGRGEVYCRVFNKAALVKTGLLSRKLEFQGLVVRFDENEGEPAVPDEVVTRLRVPQKGALYDYSELSEYASGRPRRYGPFSTPQYLLYLEEVYGLGVDFAARVGLTLLFLRNADRYLAAHLRGLGEVVKSAGAEGVQTLMRVPSMLTSCRSCGAPNPDNDSACAYCGSSLRPAV